MENIINLYKPQGLTPLQAIKKFKEQNPEYKNIKMGYAGRLDPMAEGVLVVLAGAAVAKQKEYSNLNKEYAAKILFGFETDTGDALGLVTGHTNRTVLKNELKPIIDNLKGRFKFQLPAYSSARVGGKPLYWWARQNRLNEIYIPEREVLLHDAKLAGFTSIAGKELFHQIIERVSQVQGDFRQEEIIKQWQGYSQERRADKFLIAEIRVKCASGTYIRSIAREIGRRLGASSCLLSLIRTRAGEYSTERSVYLKK